MQRDILFKTSFSTSLFYFSGLILTLYCPLVLIFELLTINVLILLTFKAVDPNFVLMIKNFGFCSLLSQSTSFTIFFVNQLYSFSVTEPTQIYRYLRTRHILSVFQYLFYLLLS